jgi:membrane protease subunit HflC
VKRVLLGLFFVLVVAIGLVAAGSVGDGWGPVVITREDEQKIILRLNEARRVTEPGISLRLPLIERAARYDRRWLYLDTEEDTIQTRDGEQLTVDNYVVWRIVGAIEFTRSFPGDMGMAEAQKRIDRAVRDDVREVIGRHTLNEVLDDKRGAVMRSITEKTRSTVEQYGIEVADVRINRTELPKETEGSVFARMVTERERLAKKSRAEGEEKARRVRAEADREARVIVAEARRDAEIARGQGDAEATRIYAEAYGTDPEFYEFLRSLEAYEKTIGERTTLVLSPKAEFFRFFEQANPEPEPAGDGGP